MRSPAPYGDFLIEAGAYYVNVIIVSSCSRSAGGVVCRMKLKLGVTPRRFNEATAELHNGR